MLGSLVHYFLHFIFPAGIAWYFYKADWKKCYAYLLGTMLVDLDHLLAHPIFDPNRCSINFHPLHSWYCFPIYIALLFFKTPYRWIGIGSCMHMLTDFLDCWI
jgi:hypothetical protein